eukprot:TRINITY_DN15926_c0_g1_i1.p1 TRINITY_DN15926_c0_g1~~TRINITY_DN15926_c0_g1_i1.p1  ORF type:complete len:207 (-),score=22.04 TRINITY_DN15926_c0_g1_i1:28-648(-)
MCCYVIFGVLSLMLLVNSQPVSVEFYVMSKCPYAYALVGQFNTNVMSFTGISSITNVTFNYIAAVDSTQPTGFYSKHGQDEVRGDFYELCVEKNYPASLWDFIYCNDYDFGGYSNIPNDVQSCAQKTQISWATLSSCYASDSSSLLKASIVKTNAAGAAYSPTLFIGGQCVYGGLPSCSNLDPTSNAMRLLICQLWTGVKPAGCSS